MSADPEPIVDPDPPARRGRIRDARGRSVRVLDPVRLHALGRRDVVESETLGRIVDDLAPGARRKRAVLVIAIPLVAALIGGLFLFLLLKGGAAWRGLLEGALNPAFFGVYAGCFLTPWLIARNARLHRAPSVMIEHRVCPHCGYRLGGLPVDPVDGATVCPECACAWRLDVPARVGAAPALEPRVALLLVAGGLLVFGVLAAVMVLKWWAP